MSKFVRNLSLFMAGLPLLVTKSVSAAPAPRAEMEPLDTTDAVPLRP